MDCIEQLRLPSRLPSLLMPFRGAPPSATQSQVDLLWVVKFAEQSQVDLVWVVSFATQSQVELLGVVEFATLTQRIVRMERNQGETAMSTIDPWEGRVRMW